MHPKHLSPAITGRCPLAPDTSGFGRTCWKKKKVRRTKYEVRGTHSLILSTLYLVLPLDPPADPPASSKRNWETLSVVPSHVALRALRDRQHVPYVGSAFLFLTDNRFISTVYCLEIYCLLSMKKIGLALGWWGAKWLAHIGVLKYLEEQNIQITEISGTSMGAIVAALFAFGHDWRQILHIIETFRYQKYVDLSLRLGLLRGNKIQKYLAEVFESKTIGEAHIPLSIVACDIDTAEEYIFPDNTPVDVALRASFSIPGIFTPVEWDGHQLVDGGLVNNLPVDRLTTSIRVASSVVSYQYPVVTQRVFFGFIRRKRAFLQMATEYLRKSYAILQNKWEELILSRVPSDVDLYHIQTDPSVRFHEFVATEQAVHHGYMQTRASLSDSEMKRLKD